MFWAQVGSLTRRWLATGGVLVVTAMALAGPSFAATLEECNGGDPFDRLKACDAIINDMKVDAATRAKALVSRAYVTYSLYGETDEPLANFSAATLLDPTSIEALIGLGGMHLKRKEYDQADATFKKALEVDPKAAGAWYFLGTVAGARGNDKQAMDDYDKALAIDKRQPLANLGKADLLAKSGHKGEALALYRFTLYLFNSRSPQYAYAQSRVQELEADLKQNQDNSQGQQQ